MTEPVQKPYQFTLATMLEKLTQGSPTYIQPFKQLRPKLEDGSGAHELAKLIHCDVDLQENEGLYLYSWNGTKGARYELSVPKPFEPQPTRVSEPQQQAQAQRQSEEEPAKADTQPTKATPELAGLFSDADTSAVASKPTPEAPENVPPATGGLFKALAALLGDATLLLTVAPTGASDGEPRLTVTALPESESAFSPICLEGSIGELDLYFVSALTSRAQHKAGLKQQIEALEAADKAVEEAKKREVEAKTKQAEAKKKAATKKEEEAKKVEQQAETQQQQSVF